MIFSVLVNGGITGFIVAFFFAFKTSFFGIPVIFRVRTVVFWTCTGILFVRPLFSVIVSLVFPLFVPAFNLQVPFGFPVTVTIFVFPDFQDFTKSPGAKPVTFRALLLCLVFKTRLDTFTFMVGFCDDDCDGALDGVGIVVGFAVGVGAVVGFGTAVGAGVAVGDGVMVGVNLRPGSNMYWGSDQSL